MIGIVVCSKSSGNGESRYYVALEHSMKIVEVRSTLGFEPGERIAAEGDGSFISTADIRPDPAGLEKLRKNAEELSGKAIYKESYRSGIGEIDAVTERMWKGLSECASLLVRKLACAAPIIVRFHNDADGSSGAYGLYKSLESLSARISALDYEYNITWIMHPSVSYGSYEAGSDLMIANSYSSIEKPLLLVIDFGTSLESNPGIAAVRDKFDVIWLDHHPIVEGFGGLGLEHYISPWLHGGDSNYTAGFLACAFAKTFSQTDTREMENASLIGDYSDFGNADEPGAELSMLLDLVTSDTRIALGQPGANLTPYEIDRIIGDAARREELTRYASLRLSEVTALALTLLKQHNGDGARIYTLDFEGIRDEQSKYPLPGRFSSKLLGKIVELESRPSILIVYSGRYISMRASKDLRDRIDLVRLIDGIKGRHGAVIEAGGGHRVAAGIKLSDKADRSRIVREIVEGIKEQLSQGLRA